MTRPKQILVADDDDNLVNILTRRCQMCGLMVERAYDGLSALQRIHAIQPDLVILDVNMPSGSGMRVCEVMSHDPRLKDVPVIMLTGRKDDETIRQCKNQGAHYVAKGPDMWSHLEPLVTSMLGLGDTALGNRIERIDPQPSQALDAPSRREAEPNRARYLDDIFTALGLKDEPLPEPMAGEPVAGKSLPEEHERPWILCIDDDRDFADSLKMRLNHHGVEVVQAFAGMAGYRTAFTSPAQAIILDHGLPDGDGEYVLRRLKENPVTHEIPVIVLTGKKDKMLERRMCGMGAASFLTKPVEWEDLWSELRRHVHLTLERVKQ